MALYSHVAGAGPDLFLVHGWGMNAAVWAGPAAALAQTHRVTRVDLPGHGNSPYGGAAGADEWADALLAAAPANAVWVGWSLGAALALHAALRAPERVKGLFLVTATPSFVRREAWPHAMPAATLGLFRATLAQDPAATLERFLALQVKGGDDARHTLRSLRRELALKPAADPAALDAGLELLRTMDLREALRSLQLPSHWLFGERDTLVPGACAEDLRRCIGAPGIEVLAGAAHAPFLSHGEQALASLYRFLDKPS